MAQIVYVTPVDDIATGIRAAFDIYAGSGMMAKIISDGKTTLKFNSMDAAGVVYGRMPVETYVEKHQID